VPRALPLTTTVTTRWPWLTSQGEPALRALRSPYTTCSALTTTYRRVEDREEVKLTATFTPLDLERGCVSEDRLETLLHARSWWMVAGQSSGDQRDQVAVVPSPKLVDGQHSGPCWQFSSAGRLAERGGTRRSSSATETALATPTRPIRGPTEMPMARARTRPMSGASLWPRRVSRACRPGSNDVVAVATGTDGIPETVRAVLAAIRFYRISVLSAGPGSPG
jgi:hypothetical protein